jgi:uncharacterized repeat protein (TIGR01451 family)
VTGPQDATGCGSSLPVLRSTEHLLAKEDDNMNARWTLRIVIALVLVALAVPLCTGNEVAAGEPLTTHDGSGGHVPGVLPGVSPGAEAPLSPEDEIPVTRWVSPDGSQPLTFAQWQARQPPPAPLHLERIYVSEPQPSAAGGPVRVLVNPGLYDGIAGSLAQWVADVEGAGWTVAVYSASFPDAPALRAYLAGIADLEGCLLIGDFPVPWYETDEFEHEEFPIDLFYMDLDGSWGDGDGDGIYDSHTGNIAPEIWVGRLTASPLMLGDSDEISLLNNYFAKNHAYRSRELVLPLRALMYVDDDWEPWAYEWGGNLALVYEDTTVISNPEVTTAWDYGDRLDDNYEWIQVCAHSWPGGHGFLYNAGQDWSWFYVSELYDIDPHAFFYNLFACSGARYVEVDYLGGWYVFVDTYGLAAVGSTKTGSMLGFGEFYGPLGEGASLGEAFQIWFEEVGLYDQAWHYGMTLLGDPTLTTAELPVMEVSPAAFDETLDWGETVTRTLTITNNGAVVLDFEIDELPPEGVSWLSEDPVAGIVPVEDAVPVIITFDASGVAEPGVYEAALQITSQVSNAMTITVPVAMTVLPPPPDLEISKHASPDPVEAGGLLTYTLVLQNLGEGDATGVTITDTLPEHTAFSHADGGGGLVDGQVQWTDPAVGAGDRLTVTFAVTVDASLEGGGVLTNAAYGAHCVEGVGVTGGVVTTTVRAEPHYVYLPLVVKGEAR